MKGAGLPFPLGYEGDIKAVQGHTAEQQQIISMLKFIDISICRLFNVDPRFIYAEMKEGTKERAKSNLPEEYTAFLNNGFRAVLDCFAGEITLKLASEPNEEAVFDTDKLTLGTFHDKAISYELLTSRSPGMTPNEGRKFILGPPELDLSLIHI